MNQFKAVRLNLNQITKLEQQRLINIQEEKIRNKFIKDFQLNYKSLTKLDVKACFDLSGITSDNKTVFIELKERQDYIIQAISASTYLEHKKMMDFRFINIEYPNSELIYFNYFITGDYINFNIKSRLDSNAEEIIDKKPIKCRETNYTDNVVLKDIHILKFNEIYNDILFINFDNDFKAWCKDVDNVDYNNYFN